MASSAFTRRDVLKASSALAVGASIPKSWAAVPLAPKRGGHLRLGVNGGAASDNLDPRTYVNGSQRLVAGSVCNYLFEIDAKGISQPELAESIEASPDAKQFRVKLRKGVEFHNGKSLSADDVIASCNLHRGENSTSVLRAVLSQIKDIRSDGSTTVVFDLAAPNADFPAVLSSYQLPIMASSDGKVDTTKLVGTGGYTISEWSAGERAILKRFPNYWRENHANFDSAEVISILDSVARHNALLTNRVDAISQCDVTTIQFLQRRKDIEISNIPGIQVYTMEMRCDTAPFGDNNVRLALKHGIDRQAMVDTIVKGFGTAGNDNPLTSAYQYFDPSIPQRTYDPDRSKFFLKKAGLDSVRVDFSVAATTFQKALETAALFKEQAIKGGIDVTIRREPDDGYWTNVWMKGTRPFFMGLLQGRATADWLLSSFYMQGAPWNVSRFKDDRFDKLLLEARSLLDEAKRKELYSEMQRIVVDEGGTISPIIPNNVSAMSNKIGHGDISGYLEFDASRAIDRWWFK